MLTAEQSKLLVDKGIIHIGSMLQLKKKAYNGELIRDYKIMKMIDGNNFVVKDMDTEDLYKANVNHIVTIDDMPISRVLDAYMVDDELSLIDVICKTNVEKDIIGKKKAKVNGVELEDGMRILLHNDSNSRLVNKPLTVRGVGDSIKLIAPRGRPKKNA